MYPTIRLGGLSVSSWNLSLVLGYLLVLAVAILRRPHEFPLRKIQIFYLSLFYFFMGMVGGVSTHVIAHSHKYMGRPLNDILNSLGLAYLGFFIFGILSIWIFCREAKAPFLVVMDYLMPIIILERVVGRIGCFMAGCCYGIPSNLPWSQDFGGLIFRHPTQIYAMVTALAIFISGVIAYPRLRRYAGCTFFMAIMLYSFSRFFNEFLRAEGPMLIGPFHTSHLILSAIFIAGLIGIYNVYKKHSAAEREKLRAGILVLAANFIFSIVVGACISLPILFYIKRLCI